MRQGWRKIVAASSSVWSPSKMPSRRPLRGPVRTLNDYDCGLTQPKPDAARWQRDVIPRRAGNDLLPALPKADGGRPDVAQVVRVPEYRTYQCFACVETMTIDLEHSASPELR
jgi:hypothetical protein